MSRDGYYGAAYKTVLVPVKVRYYENIDMVITYEGPSFKDVEAAFTQGDNRALKLQSARVSIEKALVALRAHEEYLPEVEASLVNAESMLNGLLDI